jgi:DNA polymerase-3 subunit alpha
VNPAFVHLGVHTEYSLVDSIIRIEPVKSARSDGRLETLTRRASTLGFAAIAVTDLANMFCMVKFYKAAEAVGIKPLIGAEVILEGEPQARLTLLAQNQAGYLNLLKIVSRTYTEARGRAGPTARREWLFDHAEGLIALSGPHGEIGAALLRGDAEVAQSLLEEWRGCFGDRLYLAVQRCGREFDERHTRAAVALGRISGTPLVATNDVRFLRSEDFDVHEARVCVNQGRPLEDPRRARDYTPQQYLKSAEEMAALFADLPEALSNSVEIARRCNLSFTFGINYLPDFPVPEGETVIDFLRRTSHEGLSKRLAEHPLATTEEAYRQRLDYELDVIDGMGFPGYFLIVADFIQWAKDNNVPVGPGRGSGAGSLVAYAIGITDLDPIPYNLLFERFLNPERVSMPDFDVDFCMEGRDKVIDYVTQKYGADHVGQIVTYGSMAARAVVRDVTRVLGHSHGFGDRIAKMIPGAPSFKTEANGNKCTELEYALRTIPELQRAYEEEDVKAILDLGLLLEGLARNVGKHAGGVVIAPGPLTDYVPLYRDANAEGVVTQLDMKDLESVGLVKFDFLGLRTLTIIQWAVDIINAGRGDAEALDILSIPKDDPAVYALFGRGELAAVFQMESAGMRRLAIDLQPSRFEDLVALVALFRPGPLQSGMVKDFIDRKHGRSQVSYPHPTLEPVLEDTYGVIVYQEQVMRIARELAGYTLGGADLLRRAMGKKKAEEMAKQRAIFLEGATGRGIEADVAGQIFDLMEKFAEYGFNKSHSAAYALVAYQTAWLKAHHPAAFMCAVLSAEMFKTDTLVMLVDECRRMRLQVLQPDINASSYRFTVEDARSIRYGLGAVRGVGEGAVESIIAARQQDGPFRDLFDFCRRIDLRRTNKRVLEALIHAGALDSLGTSRATLAHNLARAVAAAEQSTALADAGQVDLFGFGSSEPADAGITMDEVPDWSELDRLAHERDALGFYLTGHPIESYRDLITAFTDGDLKALIALAPEPPPAAPDEEGAESRPYRKAVRVSAAGWLIDVRRFGKRAILTLDDRSAQVFVPLSEDLWNQYSERLRKDSLLYVQGRISADEYTGGHQIRPDQILDLDQLYARYLAHMELNVRSGDTDPERLATMLEPLRQERGAAVSLSLRHNGAAAEIDFPPEFRIRLDESAHRRFQQWLGDDAVRLRWLSPES